METESSKKVAQFFECNFCDYTTCRKYNLYKHKLTSKHTELTKSHQKSPKANENSKKVAKSSKLICDKCDKEYNSRNGLWKHKQKCTFITKHENSLMQPISNEVILGVLRQNSELQQMLVEQNKTIIEMSKNNQINTNHINSHNKTFNLQFFLNETCKDAMNIMDFVDSLKIQMSDLENVGKLGYVNGISNIIIKNLKALVITKRPVHCSDQKREILYVKDDNQWHNESKGTEENKKLKKAIKHIAHKNICMIPEWKAKYPDCIYSDSNKSDIYNHIIYESMDNNDENENKIIKKIAKEVVIEK